MQVTDKLGSIQLYQVHFTTSGDRSRTTMRSWP